MITVMDETFFLVPPTRDERKSMNLVVHIACFRVKQSLFVAYYSQFHRYWLKAALEKIIP